MMNPGGSTPVNEARATLKVWKTSEASSLVCELALTDLDDTQSQLMRIMENRGWTHIRVLNLSDLCETDSNLFYQYFSDFEAATESRVHSIFSEARRDELAMKLKRKDAAPVIAAWGVSYKLSPLVNLSKAVLAGESLIGYQNKRRRYYHPQPARQFDAKLLKRKKWISELLKQLDESARK